MIKIIKKIISEITSVEKVSDDSDLIIDNLYESKSENKIIEFLLLNVVYFFIKNKKISDIYES